MGAEVVVNSPSFGACEIHVPDVNVQLAQAPVPGKAERERLLFAVPARVTFIVHRGRRSGLFAVPDDEALRIGTSVSIGLGLLSNIVHVWVGGSLEQGTAKVEAHHSLPLKPDVSKYCFQVAPRQAAPHCPVWPKLPKHINNGFSTIVGVERLTRNLGVLSRGLMLSIVALIRTYPTKPFIRSHPLVSNLSSGGSLHRSVGNAQGVTGTTEGAHLDMPRTYSVDCVREQRTFARGRGLTASSMESPVVHIFFAPVNETISIYYSTLRPMSQC